MIKIKKKNKNKSKEKIQKSLTDKVHMKKKN